MREWLVQLKGEEQDLKALSEIFVAPICNIGRDEHGYYYLRSSDFALIADEGARKERAIELVRNTNVAARSLLGGNYFAVEFDGMARIEEDGKLHRSVHNDLHTSWHVRTSNNDAAPEEAESLIALLDDRELQRVVNLFAHSLNTQDEFRRFLYGWKALDIFISKVFRRYERTFLSELGAGNNVPGADRYLRRVAEVMRSGKYSPVDKFSIVASVLAGPPSETDTKTFTRLKNFRDALAHDPDVAEASLPTDTVELQSLLSKYLRLHLEDANS